MRPIGYNRSKTGRRRREMESRKEVNYELRFDG